MKRTPKPEPPLRIRITFVPAPDADERFADALKIIGVIDSDTPPAPSAWPGDDFDNAA